MGEYTYLKGLSRRNNHQRNTVFLAKGKNLAKEIVMGSLYEGDSTWLGSGGQIIVGFIPIVGQVADIRDTYAGVKEVYNNLSSGASWANLGLTVVCWMPGMDFLKGRKVLKIEPKALAQAKTIDIKDEVIDMLNKLVKEERAEITSVAANKELYTAYKKAIKSGRSNKTGRAGFNNLRGRMKTELGKVGVSIKGNPFHHHRFPIDKYFEEAMDAGNLYRISSNKIHTEVHRIFGTTNIFKEMAWGEDQLIQDMFTFYTKVDDKLKIETQNLLKDFDVEEAVKAFDDSLIK